MRMLLDTHTLLWALADPGHLSTRAVAILRETNNTLVVSAASAWEIATKYRLGRLPGAESILAAYQAHLRVLRAEDLPIRSEHALKAGSFDVDHRDPFDRMLAAQAMLEGMPLLTNDSVFSRFADLETIW
jgi:PIN domain nuclease of toxin-antitoxin system